MTKQLTRLSAGLLALAFSLPLAAENSTTVGGYTIHHNAITTDSLPPEIAQHYGFTRSPNRGMVTITVMENRATGQPQAVPAQVAVTATNLTGQTRDIGVHEVKEQHAIYYIGDFPVSNEETLNFTLKVKPEGSSQTYTAEFSQQFFTR